MKRIMFILSLTLASSYLLLADNPWRAAIPLASAQDKDADAPAREKLIADLIAKGDLAVTKKERESAISMYRYAALFAPKDSTIQDKLAAARKLKEDDKFRGLGENGLEGTKAMLNMPSTIFGPWPDVTPAMELPALRILTNTRLVGDLCTRRAAASTGDHPAVDVFLAKPNIKVDDLVKKVGAPSDKKTDAKSGSSLFEYGRIRIIADKTGAVVAVYFRP